MPISRRLVLALPLLPATTWAQGQFDNKRGVLGHLSAQIGTYNYDAVLNDPALRARLVALLGEPGVRLLAQNLQTVTPIAFDGASLILRGLRPRSGGEEEAFLGIRPHDGALEVAILSRGRITLTTQLGAGTTSEMLAPWLARNPVPVTRRDVPLPRG